MSAHTPGPWAVDGTLHSGDLDVISAEGRITMIDDSRATGWNEPTIKANARLIAAAPDLLAALQIVAGIWSHDQTANIDPESPLAKVRAAIKKATGENA